MMILASFYFDLWYLAVLALVAFILCLDARVPAQWYPALGLVLGVRAVAVIAGGLQHLDPKLFKVIPPEVAMTKIFDVVVPVFGHIELVYGALIWIVATFSRIPILMLIGYAYLRSTSLSDVTKLLVKLRVPAAGVFVFTLALKFTPYMLRDINTLVSAQRLRGWQVNSLNPIKIFSRMKPLLYPILRSLLVTVDEVSIAVQIRGFKGDRFGLAEELKLGAKNIAISAAILGVFALLLLLLFRNNVGMI